jgi:peptidyl-prolyl cis-trans isomerase SurA
MSFLILGPCFANTQVYKIAAKVNDKVITTNEVAVRAKLMQLYSGLNIEFSKQALKDLVNEQLQIQEAQKYGVTEDSERIDASLKDMAQKLDGIEPKTKDDFLQSLKGQLRAQVTWPIIIRQFYSPSVIVTDDDIQEKLQELEYQKSQKKYLVSEIFLPFEEAGSEQQLLERSKDIVAQLRQGLPFSIVATQISKSPTASAGGSLGWIVPGQNDPLLDNTLKKMNAGETSDPIKKEDGYIIYQIKDIKIPGQKSIDDTVYSFNQVSIPSTWSEESLTIHIRSLMEAKGCDDFEKQATGNSEIQFKRNTSIKATNLSPILQDLLMPLQEGEKTKPMKTPDGIVFFMLCKKDFKQEALPSKAEIKETLEQKRYALFSTQHLKMLNKTSLIKMMD